MNALAQNMFSCDVNRLSFRCQTFNFSRPKCVVLLLVTARREDVSNQPEGKKLSERCPTLNDLRNQVKELAQVYSFSEVRRRLGCSFINR